MFYRSEIRQALKFRFSHKEHQNKVCTYSVYFNAFSQNVLHIWRKYFFTDSVNFHI